MKKKIKKLSKDKMKCLWGIGKKELCGKPALKGDVYCKGHREEREKEKRKAKRKKK